MKDFWNIYNFVNFMNSKKPFGKLNLSVSCIHLQKTERKVDFVEGSDHNTLLSKAHRMPRAVSDLNTKQSNTPDR